jgi:hypothetical protein
VVCKPGRADGDYFRALKRTQLLALLPAAALAAERCKSISSKEIKVAENERGALIKVPYYQLFRRQEAFGTRRSWMNRHLDGLFASDHCCIRRAAGVDCAYWAASLTG